MTTPQLRDIAQDSCKEDQYVHDKDSVSHVEFVFIALVTTGGVQSHPIRIETSGHRSTNPAVVGSQGRVVQPPVVQVILAAVHIPGDKE